MSVRATLLPSILDGDLQSDGEGRLYRRDLPPGAISYAAAADGGVSAIMFVCPCGCGVIGSLPVRGDHRPRWKFDGNREAPTLTPSIQKTSGCRWHGHLTAGEFRPC